MENIIKKAIEGGYTKGKSVMNEITGEIYLRANPEMFTLDPLFWQALTKTTHPHTKNVWINTAMCFYQINLNEGWDKAVEYLEELIK